MCCCDDNPPSVFNAETIGKARKPHKCYECRRVIAAGESYDLYSGIWDGRFESYKWCAHCVAAQRAYEAITGDHCYCFGTLWEGIGESIGHILAHDRPVSRLIAGARRGWRYRRGPRAGQLMPLPAVPAKEVAA